MNQEILKFTADTAQSVSVGTGIYHAVKVSGTFTNVVVSDAINGTVATVTGTDAVALHPNNYGITTPITFTPTGVSGTVTVYLQWVAL